MLHSGNDKCQTKKIMYCKGTMPLILTMVVLIILVSFIGITRGLIHRTYEGANIPALSSNVLVSNNTQLNESEGTVLTSLWNVMDLSNETVYGNTTNLVYYRNLREHFSKNGVNLTANQAADIEAKLNNLQDIINYEGRTDYSKMTLDGREVAIYLSEQIYEICGLKIVIEMDGAVNKISDQQGNTIYQYVEKPPKALFQVNALIITLSSIFILFSICIIVAKKNQLLGKEVIYDGIDEERYA